MKRRDFIKTGLLSLGAITCASCGEMFEYSPYEVRLPDSRKHTHAANFTRLIELQNRLKTREFLNIGLIADSHTWYDSLKAAVDSINQKGNIDFVIHGGDITDFGLQKEYEFSQDILRRLDPTVSHRYWKSRSSCFWKRPVR